MASSIRIRVKTEHLMTCSEAVQTQVNRLRKTLTNIETLVNRSGAYWENDGHSAYVRAYQTQKTAAGTALKHFSDNVRNLQQIAGVYSATENQIENAVSTLPTDVIS